VVTAQIRFKPGFQRGHQLVSLFGDNSFLVFFLLLKVWVAAAKVNQFGEHAASRANQPAERGSVTRSNFASQNAH